jgi:hypothetical protein
METPPKTSKATQLYNQVYYQQNKERLNRERCAKAKADAQRKRAIKHIMSQINALYVSIEGDNIAVVMEDPDLQSKYNDLVTGIREKHLEKLKLIN